MLQYKVLLTLEQLGGEGCRLPTQLKILVPLHTQIPTAELNLEQLEIELHRSIENKMCIGGPI